MTSANEHGVDGGWTETSVARMPWERQSGETSRAWAAFVTYRDMGGSRSVRNVAARLGKSRQKVGVLAARYRWVDRAAAYDAELDRELRAWQRAERRRAARAHVGVARACQAVAIERLQAMTPGELSVRELGRWFEVSVRIERTALGVHQAVDHVAADADPDLSEALRNELVAIDRLLSSLGSAA